MPNRLLIDTNIIIDYMVPDRPEHAPAMALMRHLADSDDIGMISIGTLKDAYYTCHRHLGEDRCRQLIRLLIQTMELPPVTRAEAQVAAWSDEPDFEDGLIRAIAERNRCGFIINRDRAAFQRSTVRSMDATEWVRLFA